MSAVPHGVKGVQMRVAIASDHAGEGLLETTVDAIRAAGHEPVVIGQAAEGDDYPDVALAVGGAIRTGQAQRGVVLCGSGAGVTVAANKIPLVRAALAYETYTARQMVEHDDVNVLALGARVLGPAVAADVVSAFVTARFSGAARHSRRLGKVLAMEATRVQGAAADLIDRGQQLWLDGVDAAALEDGRVAHWIGDLAVSGVTTAPDALAEALRAGTYAGRIDGSVADPEGEVPGTTAAEALALALLLADACGAADLLSSVHGATAGAGGHASVDLPPSVIDDVDATLEVARRLHALADRSNVMVKVPATRAGHNATRRLIEGGVPVHSTLVYSVDQYRAAAQAYLDGVERRLRAGDDPAVGGAISVPVAAWDQATADRLPESLHNTVGLHVARSIAEASDQLRESDAARALADAGALPQQVMFGDLTAPAPLPPAYYIDALDAGGVALLLSQRALEALDDTASVVQDQGGAAVDAGKLEDAGVSLDALATRLQHDGLRRAAAGWEAMLAALAAAAEPSSA
jgi:transaldolase